MTEKKAKLLLEDGTLLTGSGFGWEGMKAGEVVFNTALSGYQEIITDPSYASQIVVMCYPHIGNYGVNSTDSESFSVWCRGLVVRKYTSKYSNHRAEESLEEFMVKNNLPGIEGVDTRALVKKIREKGAMKGVLACGEYSREQMEEELKSFPSIETCDLAREVNESPLATYKNYSYRGKEDCPVVVVVDYGAKLSILKKLENTGVRPVVISASSKIEDVLELSPAGVLLSNGPGDPAMVSGGIKLAAELLAVNKTKYLPVMGICMGNQLIALASGARTFKLKFGHHGSNHPVKELSTGKVEITSQNHNYCVDYESLPGEFEVTHINLNDKTVEGVRHSSYPVIGCQYHPEAGPGPYESAYIFEKFRSLINA